MVWLFSPEKPGLIHTRANLCRKRFFALSSFWPELLRFLVAAKLSAESDKAIKKDESWKNAVVFLGSFCHLVETSILNHSQFLAEFKEAAQQMTASVEQKVSNQMASNLEAVGQKLVIFGFLNFW